jgi:hypothetical protein
MQYQSGHIFNANSMQHSLFEKLSVLQPFKIFPYPESDESSPRPFILFLYCSHLFCCVSTGRGLIGSHSRSSSTSQQKARQVMYYKVTLRHDNAIIVAVLKQYSNRYFECLYSCFIYLAIKSERPRRSVICPVWLHRVSPRYLIIGMILVKKSILNTHYVF